MTRENVQSKSRRLLTEGRLLVKLVGPQGVAASCRGDSGEVYQLGWDPDTSRWVCSCQARVRCSHIAALQLCTVAPHPQNGEAT